MYKFIKYPFVRLLIPFVLGLFCGDYLFTHNISLPFLEEILCTSLVVLLCTAFLKRYSCRHYFGGLLYFSLFLGALYMLQEKLRVTHQEYPTEKTLYRVRLLDEAKAKKKTVMFPAHVICHYDSLGQSTQHQGVVYLYFYEDSTWCCNYSRGDEVLLFTQLATPFFRNNFDEFNYPRYLLHHGISGQGFVYNHSSCKVPHHTSTSFFQDKACHLRSQIEQSINQLDLKPEYKSIILALTIGEREGLSKALYHKFSVAGVSHVLALSGFHIALLAALLTFVLKHFPLKYRGKKFCDALLVILFLFFYCYITGGSPSVVRSVVMYSMLSVSYLLRREAFSINSLAVTAFFMLLVNPLWLFDVGFQLSFMAVLFILLLQPPLYRFFNALRYTNKSISGLLSVSIAAQVGTFPLILYYFSQISTHFLLANLLVVPLVALVVYLCYLLLFLLFFIKLAVPSFILVLQGVLYLLVSLIDWISSLPGASFASIWFDCYDLFLSYLFLLLCVVFYYSSYKLNHLYQLLVVLLFGVAYHSLFYITHEAAPGIRFYNVKGAAVHCVASSDSSYLVFVDSTTSRAPLQQSLSRYFMHYHIASPHLITHNYSDNHLVYHPPLLFFRGKSIMMVGNNNWQKYTLSTPTLSRFKVDYLYLYSGFKGNLSDLSDKFSIGYVVVDSSLSKYYRTQIASWCKKYNKPFISLLNKGSVEFLF